MKRVSVNEAKAHFSALMKDVESGEVIIVTRHDKPIMEMRSIAGVQVPQLGAFADPGSPHVEVGWSEAELGELLGGSS